MKRETIKKDKKNKKPVDTVRLPVPPPNKVEPDKTKYNRTKKHKGKEKPE